MKDGAFEKWIEYLLVRNSDQSKDDSLSNGLALQFSMENNQYPKNNANATDILNNHKHDCRAYQGDRKQKKSWYTSKKKEGDETLSMTSSETSFSQGGKDRTCYCYSKKGHMISPECPDKKTIKKKDWCIRKAQLNMQAQQQQQDDQEDTESTMDTGVTSNRSSSRVA